MSDFQAIVLNHIYDEDFYEIVAKVAGEPEDDGESEWALLERLDSLPIEKQKELLKLLGK